MLNRRFRKTEEAILAVFLEGDSYASTRQIAKKAGVSPSTFYRHHATVKRIARDYEDYVMWGYCRMMAPYLKRKNIKMRQFFFKMLVFMLANKRSLMILYRSEDEKIMERMVIKLKPKILNYLRLTGEHRKIFNVYVAEIVAVLMHWGENNFKESEINETLNDIMYLTDTARARLRPMMLKKG